MRYTRPCQRKIKETPVDNKVQEGREKARARTPQTIWLVDIHYNMARVPKLTREHVGWEFEPHMRRAHFNLLLGTPKKCICCNYAESAQQRE